MKGSIRFFLGLLLTMFAVGGIEHSVTDKELAVAVLAAVAGLVITAWGVNSMKGNS